MRVVDGRIVLSASDLMRFMGCVHAAALDLAQLRGAGPKPREDSADAELLQKQGAAHEAAHLARLHAAGRNVVEIARGNLAIDAESTRAALASGPDVVFQGAFLSGSWGGWSDFLERVDRPSALGPFSYEVTDTKLKRRPHPKHVLQLVLYSDLLTEVQGAAPHFAHIELGNGTRATLRLSEYADYARIGRTRLEVFVADPQPTRPIPCADCGLCRWGDHCADVWKADDSLFNVANISRGQVKKLEAAGIQTMEALASLDHPIRGMAENTRLRLVTQARLQHARKTGMPAYELRVPEEVEEDADTQELRSALAASDLPGDRQEVLFNLGLFHKREAKPAQWAVFDSVGKDEDDLIDDLHALAGLEAVGAAEPVKRSMARTYRFPPQETKLRGGRSATVPVHDGPPATISIAALDRTAREITLKAGAAKAHLLSDRLTLHPDWPLNTGVIAAALRDVMADQCGPRRFTAVDDLLSRAAPRLTTGTKPDLLDGADPVAGAIAAVCAMNGTVLPIQGPPGTGKTYVTARAILSLVRKGYRVGVASNSHEAIRNVLMGCLAALEDNDPDIFLEDAELAHKVSGDEDSYPEGFTGITRATSNDDPALTEAHVVGGTAFFFSRPDFEQTLDWLFVDEAGQVSLANMVAMGRAARNIVLVGDPRQLPQVIQGAHPDPANLSCLDWMLGDHATVPPDRGIFLPVSRRMHPEVCRFISEQVYEGRLTSHPDTSRQAVTGTTFPAAGAFWMPVPHEGNAQIAPEEVAAIWAAARELLTGAWTEKDGTIRPMREYDIIVVAPYNAQVNALREALPEGIRVGTVDKFQGQEAPVCLVSMTASSAEETPRGMDFAMPLIWSMLGISVGRQLERRPIEASNAVEALAMKLALGQDYGEADPRVRGRRNLPRVGRTFDELRKPGAYVTQPFRQTCAQPLVTLGLVEGTSTRFNSFRLTDEAERLLGPLAAVHSEVATWARGGKRINWDILPAILPTAQLPDVVRAELTRRIYGDGATADRRKAIRDVGKLLTSDRILDAGPESLAADHLIDLRGGIATVRVRKAALSLLGAVETLIARRREDGLSPAISLAEAGKDRTIQKKMGDCVDEAKRAAPHIEAAREPESLTFLRECETTDRLLQRLARRDGVVIVLRDEELAPGPACGAVAALGDDPAPAVWGVPELPRIAYLLALTDDLAGAAK